MRKTVNILIVLLLNSIACNTGLFQKEDGACIGIVFDISDDFRKAKEINRSHLKNLFESEGTVNASATCFISYISHLRHTEIQEFRMPGSTINGNILERQKLYDTLYARIIEEIQRIHQSVGTDASYVAFAIAEMLQKVSACKDCRSKKVIVFGDLGENTPIFSFYSKTDHQKILTAPQTVEELFDREYPLPKLDGIELVFINRTFTKNQDEAYHQAYLFFKKYYESHGARVSISTSLTESTYGK